MSLWFPPHARGWCRRTEVQSTERSAGKIGCFPRTRGDGPFPGDRRSTSAPFPPHARGWTLRARLPLRGAAVSPARAGMDPTKTVPGAASRGFPRTRGDGPQPER